MPYFLFHCYEILRYVSSIMTGCLPVVSQCFDPTQNQNILRPSKQHDAPTTMKFDVKEHIMRSLSDAKFNRDRSGVAMEAHRCT